MLPKIGVLKLFASSWEWPWARGDLTCEFVRRGVLKVRVDWERESLLRMTVKVTLMSFSDLAT